MWKGQGLRKFTVRLGLSLRFKDVCDWRQCGRIVKTEQRTQRQYVEAARPKQARCASVGSEFWNVGRSEFSK